MPTPSFAAWSPILLPPPSNVFMTLAWYGHLKFKSAALMFAVIASSAIAVFEFCLAAPADRIGHAVYSAAQLINNQDLMRLFVFYGFSVVYLKEQLGRDHLIGFSLIAASAAFRFKA